MRLSRRYTFSGTVPGPGQAALPINGNGEHHSSMNTCAHLILN